MNTHYRGVEDVLRRVFFLNLLVAGLKFFFGYLANSLSMMADGVHSVFDSTSNVIGIAGIRASAKPPDKVHTYGHRKFEYFATLAISIILIVTAAAIIKSAFGRFFEPVIPQIEYYTFLVMVLATLINYLVAGYERAKSVEYSSDILYADSEHTRSDMLASISVMVGFVAVGMGYPIFDTIIAFGIGAYIAHIGLGIMKKALGILSDESPVDTLKVKKIVEGLRGVRDCHRIRARGSKNEAFIDLHILVDPEMSVSEAHGISDEIERALKEKFGCVSDVVVHVEPEV
jgi:cation diffusion facilitator family transporter